ncbi:MAG: aminopeptidase P family protein [Pyrinomonadaceae bacterium]
MRLKNVLVLIFVCALGAGSVAGAAAGDTGDKGKAIRTAPPAPKFTDAERQRELAARRASVAKEMDDNSVMILFSADPKIYAGDVDFYYRQENNLYYLTNLKQNNATLVLLKKGGQTSEFLFLPKRNPQAETWNGRMYSNEEAANISGLKTIFDASELKGFLNAVKGKSSFISKGDISVPVGEAKVYLLSPNASGPIYRSEYPKEDELAGQLTGSRVADAGPIFNHLRLTKSPMEIKLLQHAVDITTEALMRSMGVVGRAEREYEVQAEVEYTFRRRNADYWGYPSIVGCGPNATTLHYVESQGEIKKSDLLLMDVGAEYDHYTADVTRTFPVSGKFTKEQAEIYQIVYDAQEAAAKTIRPGASFGDPSGAASEVIEAGLAKLGLITAPGAPIPGTRMPQSQLWYMHGWGHWLGMNVHDVGSYGAVLKEGMIMTNEPGIYIRGNALDYLPKTVQTDAFFQKIRPAFEKYKNIGVRIEDDMLVTKDGVEWMTKALPRSISDIEAFMGRASREMASAGRLPEKEAPVRVLSGAEPVWNPLQINAVLSGQTLRSGYFPIRRASARDRHDRAG